jgi:hypothetical protein
MNSRELLQQALEFAERICGDRCNAEYNPCEAKDLAEAIRAHLEKPEPEPVAREETPGVTLSGFFANARNF